MIDWQRVQQLFLEAVDLASAERASFLAERCAGEPELRSEIESLLLADHGSGASIERAVQDEAVSLLDSQKLVGERLGTYRIVKEIGRGGMGSVYLALRDDQEFRKEVALKIVRRGMDTAEVLARFRHERQILANLEHPYIACLFDGGSTGDGVPFFVMEYVEGKPVSVFCNENKLDYRARCELFILILEAVAYAHRRLVVHRDLKPANILITADGVPKLLDFGIAKLLGSAPEADRTQIPATLPYTPEYASPEQVRGQPITTATDIYSLGAILYEMLIGKPAQPIDSPTPSEIERIVCETEIARPTLKARDLPSDIDNIVMMAMRKSPDRRYESAVQFAEDLRRYLDGRPVIAHQDSVRYRVTKFILRNRAKVALFSLILISLVAGLAASLVQTRRAEQARRIAESQRQIAIEQTRAAETARLAESAQKKLADEQRIIASQRRDQAEQEKLIADQRLKDIIELAGRTLFDAHDAIANLPGSIPARKALVNTTLDYLKTLEKTAGLDDQVREALSASYYKIAMIEGNPQGASLQDFQGAEASLLKGEAIIMPAYTSHPNDPGFMLRIIELRSGLAELRFRSNRREQGIRNYIDLVDVAHRLALVKRCPLLCKWQAPALETALAHVLLPTDPQKSLKYADMSIAELQAILVQHPDEPIVLQGLGAAMSSGASAYSVLGELEKSSDYFRQSIAAREKLLHNDPNNLFIRRNLMIAYGNYAILLGDSSAPSLNRPDEARAWAAKSVAIARDTMTAAPDDATARHDLGLTLSRSGMIDPGSDGTAASLKQLEEAAALFKPILQANPTSSETAAQFALAQEFQGIRLETLKRDTDAIASYKSSMATLEPFLNQQNPTVTTQYIASEERFAILIADEGDVAAIGLANQSLLQAEKLTGSAPRSENQTLVLAKAWSTLAVVQSKLGMTQQATQSAATGLQLWGTVTKPVLLKPYSQTITDTRHLLKPEL